MASDTPGVDGLRVVEYAGANSGIAAAYAGFLLAGMGARVTRLVPPDDPSGDAPKPSSTPIDLALEVLANGKQSAPCPTTTSGFNALLASADVLLCDAPRDIEALLGPVKDLNKTHPHLIAGIATTFGLDGPYAGMAGTGLDAQALAAVAWSMGEPGRAPLTLPPGIVDHQSGAQLAAGCLLSLVANRGQIVDIALADVLASYVAGNCRFYVHHGLEWRRSGRRASGSGGAYPFVNLPCKDGQVCICGRTRDEWNRLVKAMGSPDWAELPRYQRLRAMGTQYPEEVDDLVMPWFARHTKAELEAIALEHNLIVAPIRDLVESLETPHFTDRGFLVEDEVAGQSVRTPALPFQIRDTRAAESRDITRTLLAKGSSEPWNGVPTATATPAPAEQPLTGLRVLDFGWVWSAPWVGAILGELGAEVIKVEHGKRPDNLRLAGRVTRNGVVVEGPSMEMSPMYHQINHGKLGITLNTKEPAAVALLKRLAAMSDVVIENMSPGSLERSGLGYADLNAIKPDIVMLAMSVAGQHGALSTMRAYAPTMSSFVGMEALVGYGAEAPIGALNFALSDPGASTHALAPLLAALRRARTTGAGCYIDFSQIESLLGTLRPYLLDNQVNGRQPPPLGNGHPAMAPHGLYPTAGEDHWLTLSVGDDESWQRLIKIAKGETWASDERLRMTTGRLARRVDLDAAIAKWTARHDRDALIRMLRGAGLASMPVLTLEEQWRDPHFAARKTGQVVDIPFYGPESLIKAPWRFSSLSPQISRSGPTTGEHNHYVFHDLLGLSAGEIASLEAEGVIA
jgi:crotonobetainyl-CoA:carnitine CoA-transferase CaiB-like acyl-CoA transferase